MPDLPSSLALGNIPDGAEIVAADHRNNYNAIELAVNNLLAALSGGLQGEVLTAADTDTVGYAYPPGYEVAYGEQTLSSDITALTEAAADTIVTAPAFTFDGVSKYLIEFACGGVRPDITAASRQVDLWLFQDGVSIGRIASVVSPAANNLYTPVRAARRMTPSAGAHTYSIRASVNGGTGTFLAGLGGAGTDFPAFIRITKAV